METLQDKIAFLKVDVCRLMGTIQPNALPIWGKMNPQQMVEHLVEYVGIAYGKVPVDQILSDEARVAKMQMFLHTEKPFMENTPNPLMPSEPPATTMANMEDAIHTLQASINEFFNTYEHNPALVLSNAFFGELNFELQVRLLYKHTKHHLRQFGVQA